MIIVPLSTCHETLSLVVFNVYFATDCKTECSRIHESAVKMEVKTHGVIITCIEGVSNNFVGIQCPCFPVSNTEV